MSIWNWMTRLDTEHETEQKSTTAESTKYQSGSFFVIDLPVISYKVNSTCSCGVSTSITHSSKVAKESSIWNISCWCKQCSHSVCNFDKLVNWAPPKEYLTPQNEIDYVEIETDHTSKSGLFTSVFNRAVFPHSSSPTTTSLYLSTDVVFSLIVCSNSCYMGK